MAESPHPGALTELKNLGPKSTEWLTRIGIKSVDDLRRVGSLEIYRRLRRAGIAVNCLMVYALEGALLDTHWNSLPAEWKEELRNRVHAINEELKAEAKKARALAKGSRVQAAKAAPIIESAATAPTIDTLSTPAQRAQDGYSGTPLAQKLGLKAGASVYVIGSPKPYAFFFDESLPAIEIIHDAGSAHSIIHWFTHSNDELEARLPELLRLLAPGGMLWVSWPKRSSKPASTVTEDTIRSVALPLGLVDIKVCAIDHDWSGLKLVRRNS